MRTQDGAGGRWYAKRMAGDARDGWPAGTPEENEGKGRRWRRTLAGLLEVFDADAEHGGDFGSLLEGDDGATNLGAVLP